MRGFLSHLSFQFRKRDKKTSGNTNNDRRAGGAKNARRNSADGKKMGKKSGKGAASFRGKKLPRISAFKDSKKKPEK